VEDETFKLDGRQFRGVAQDLSAAQDDYIVAHLRRAGAVEALTDSTTPDEKRAEQVLTHIMLAGETFAVLAGCLTEVGKKWTRADAERNAARFAEITDRTEKLAMRAALIGFVIGFFEFGTKSSETSQRFSGPTAAGPSTKNAAPPTTEISLPSSERSLAENQAASTN
jgi:hypothetical protein